MCDIGDVHAHLPKVFADGTDRECVVKVLGVVGVDGAGEHIAHVEAACYFVGRDGVADVVGRLLYCNGVFVGEAKLGEYGMHLGIIVSGPA